LSHVVQGGYAAPVKGAPDLGAEPFERPLLAPRRSVGTVRDERVVDIADAEHAGRKVKLIAGESVGVAAAVEALVVVAHEPEHLGREAAEAADQLLSVLGVAADDRVLARVERAGLVEDRVRDRELADVVEKAGDRDGAQNRRRKSECLSDLDCAPGHAPGVPGGVGVLLGKASRQRKRLAGEECLRGNEIRVGRIPGQSWPLVCQLARRPR